MPKGEFENRDRDESSDLSGIPLAGGLGELPEDLATERGDLDNYALRAAANVAPDMVSAQRSRIDAGETGLGSPKIDYSVRSIFDSRPVNSREFNLWFFGEIAPETEFDIEVFRKCFFVPQGYVCVLREAIIVQAPQLTIPLVDGFASIMIDGAIVDPPDVEVGPDFNNTGISQDAIAFQSNEPIPTFILADEGQAVGLDIEFFDDTFVPSNENVEVGFRGHFLLKTGVPAQFQAANEAGRAKAAVTSNRNDLALSAGQGVALRGRRRVPFPNVPILRGK